jgi:hypothetical protein
MFQRQMAAPILQSGRSSSLKREVMPSGALMVTYPVPCSEKIRSTPFSYCNVDLALVISLACTFLFVACSNIPNLQSISSSLTFCFHCRCSSVIPLCSVCCWPGALPSFTPHSLCLLNNSYGVPPPTPPSLSVEVTTIFKVFPLLSISECWTQGGA